MTEHDLKRALFKTYQMRLPVPHEVLKHNDRSTAGVPDHTVSVLGYTSWIELKVLDPREDIRKSFRPGQLPTCKRLERTTGGRCWIVAYRKGPHRWDVTTEIWRPTAIKPGEMDFPSPDWFDDERPNHTERLWHAGYLRFTGHAHERVVELILATHRITVESLEGSCKR